MKRKEIVFILLLLLYVGWGGQLTKDAYHSFLRYQQVSQDITSHQIEYETLNTELSQIINNIQTDRGAMMRIEQKNEVLDQLSQLTQVQITSITGYKRKEEGTQAQIAVVQTVEEAKQFPYLVNQIDCVLISEDIMQTIRELEQKDIAFESATVTVPNRTILVRIRFLGGGG